MSGAILVSGRGRRPCLALAASVAVEAAQLGRPTVLAEVRDEPRARPPTLLCAPGSRDLEQRLRDEGLRAAARGAFCHLAIAGEGDPIAELAVARAACPDAVLVAQVPAELWVAALECEWLAVRGGVVVCALPGQRALAALAVGELTARGCRARVEPARAPGLAARRALAGVRPGGELSRRARRICSALLPAQAGQALPLVLAACLCLIGSALILAAIGGAVIGKGRAQRAADLAAISAVRSMRDDLPRLLSSPRLADGRANPRHLTRRAYLRRARSAGIEGARRNGVDAGRVLVTFPDRSAEPPLRATVRLRGELDPRRLPGGERPRGSPARPVGIEVAATAEATLPGGAWTGAPSIASGGGYSGPLAHRDGEGMRPDVAVAYDRMHAAARAAGHELVVSSGFRSDAEQATLFAAHPDPRWVAPPGRSLHRCATELDLGSPSAYGWLAANASRFGFMRRYPWEPWHFGFAAGPAPCSPAAEAKALPSGGAPGPAGRGASGPDGAAAGAAVPAFVPAAYRQPILRAAGRRGVSAALLAAQLMAESGFRPDAVSPAGARGIAQFMPATAAAYGLRDPFDPVAAIEAQAHLMGDLLAQFGSVALALAAYNAGPGAVAACGCVPPYPETQAYVSRVLALLGGVGELAAPKLEVRLVD